MDQPTESRPQGASSNGVLTVVLQMPENLEQRRKIIDAIGLGRCFHEGMVVAMSMEDEITAMEYLEEHVDDDLLADARKHAKAIHAAV